MRRDLVSWGRRGLVLGLCLILTACATPSRLQGEAGGFTREGRFAVNAVADGAQPRAAQGGFAWRDDGHHYQLDLTNPFGSTVARLEGQTGSVVLIDANGQRTEASTPDALAQRVLGEPMPVQDLRDWLQGRPASDGAVTDMQRDPQGHLTGFTQDGWLVLLSDYDSVGPRRLSARRSALGQRVDVRLVVNAS